MMSFTYQHVQNQSWTEKIIVDKCRSDDYSLLFNTCLKACRCHCKYIQPLLLWRSFPHIFYASFIFLLFHKKDTTVIRSFNLLCFETKACVCHAKRTLTLIEFAVGQMQTGKEGNIVSTNPSTECQRSQDHVYMIPQTHWNSLLFFFSLFAALISVTWLELTGSFFFNSLTMFVF